MDVREVFAVDNRIKSMMINDKKENPNKIVGLLKSEIFYILKNYMDVKLEDIVLDICIDNNGKYVVSFNVEASRMYLVNHFI